MEFSQDEVIRRTARTMRVKPEWAEDFMSVYADQYIRHARETDPTILVPVSAPAEPAPKAARKRTKPKASTPAKPGPRTADEALDQLRDAFAQEAAEREAADEAVGNPS